MASVTHIFIPKVWLFTWASIERFDENKCYKPSLAANAHTSKSTVTPEQRGYDTVNVWKKQQKTARVCVQSRQ